MLGNRSSVVALTSLRLNGLSLNLKALPLAVVTPLRKTSWVRTYGNSSTWKGVTVAWQLPGNEASIADHDSGPR